ncbi:unnamed protein product [Ambrosiozyma monospora]|uniref:Unnamed protein product n=1 Tax=Ambrosiozyma monospora TaxID=43982 RepID=A0ACB5T4W6_AMBMO|nr:unnamed protein product [Ambrosiozyma monospora]
MRSNADLLNLVQIGITLSDKEGKRPEGVPSTWQFNFKFDLENEMFSRESIESLATTGINFQRLKESGIDQFEFAQVLIDSGLCLLPEVTWISFHAGYDFGFLVSLLINKQMPSSEDSFEEWLQAYFPTYYDIKFIAVNKIFANNAMRSRLTLESLAEELGVIRNVNLNILQVGGQSMLTYLCFWELKRLLGAEEMGSSHNQIWGITDESPFSLQSGNNGGQQQGNGQQPPSQQQMPQQGQQQQPSFFNLNGVSTPPAQSAVAAGANDQQKNNLLSPRMMYFNKGNNGR